MKKTLAAVLAAAMALSTASVVLAKDVNDFTITDQVTNSTGTADNDIEADGLFNKDISKFLEIENIDIVESGDTVYSGPIFSGALHDLVKEGLLRSATTITSGRSNLSGTPTVERKDGGLRVKVKFKHTYGTSDVSAEVRVRLTATKNITMEDVGLEGSAWDTKGDGTTVFLRKGDTLTFPEIKFTADYREVTAYGEDMTITLRETNDDEQYVKIKGETLYANAGSDDKVDIWFDNYAVLSTKVSPTQKNVNMYYKTDEISEIVDAYPAVDFQFIQFMGKPKFTNSSTMTFNANNGSDTQVYSWDGEALTPLDGKYDPTYKTIEVKGIKQLGTYVIASEILEEEVDEPAEPVSSAPVVEEPEEDENPKTGAC